MRQKDGLTKWDLRMYALAEDVASWSKDPERKVGAVVTADRGRVLYTGYNGLPASIPDDPEVIHDRDRRLRLTVHAEANAVLHALASLSGWTTYVTEHPCHACALLLASVGVSRVVCPHLRESSRWAESQRAADEVFRRAGVELVRF